MKSPSEEPLSSGTAQAYDGSRVGRAYRSAHGRRVHELRPASARAIGSRGPDSKARGRIFVAYASLQPSRDVESVWSATTVSGGVVGSASRCGAVRRRGVSRCGPVAVASGANGVVVEPTTGSAVALHGSRGRVRGRPCRRRRRGSDRHTRAPQADADRERRQRMTAYVAPRDHRLRAAASGPSITVDSADVAEYRTDLAAGQSVVLVRAGSGSANGRRWRDCCCRPGTTSRNCWRDGTPAARRRLWPG